MIKEITKNLIPVAIVVAGVLIAVAVIVSVNPSFFANFASLANLTKSESHLSADEAAEKAINYINENMLQEGTTASLISSVPENGLYKFQLKIGDREFNSYVTQDGKVLFTEAEAGIKLDEKPAQAENQEATPEETKEYSLETLENLAKCLTKKGAKFYGSSGCGWCNRQKTLFGEAAQYLPYVGCANEKTKHLCEEAKIGPIPTWDFPDGQRVEGFQSIEKLAELSGCPLQ